MDSVTEMDMMLKAEGDTSLQLDDIIDAPVAIATSLITSTLNSFLPESWEISTSTALNAISNDAASFYENHRMGVEMSSLLLGGFLLPGAGLKVGSKLVNLATRNAMVGKIALPLKALGNKSTLYGEAAIQAASTMSTASAEYRVATRKMATMAALEGVGTGVLWEASFAVMMNGHPLMKDDGYGVNDFLLGATIGSAMAPFSALKSLKAVKSEALKIEASRISNTENLVAAESNLPTMTSGDALGLHSMVLKNQMGKVGEFSGEEARMLDSFIKNSMFNSIQQGNELLAPSLRGAPIKHAEDATMLDRNLVLTTKAFEDLTPIEHVLRTSFENPTMFTGVKELRPTIEGMELSTSQLDINIADTGDILNVNKLDFLGYPELQGQGGGQTFPSWFKVTDDNISLDFKEIPDLSLVVDAIKVFSSDAARAGKSAAIQLQNSTKELTKGLQLALEQSSNLAHDFHSIGETLQTYDQIAAKLPDSVTPGVVYTTWAGFGRAGAIDSIQAGMLRGAADTKGWTPDTRWDILTGSDSALSSVPKADGDFISAHLAAQELTPAQLLTQLSINPANLPQIQGIYSKLRGTSNENFPKLRTTTGEEITSMAQLADLLKVSKETNILANKHLAPEQVSKLTNTPLDRVQDILGGQTAKIYLADDLIVYSAKGSDFSKYYTQPTLLSMNGNSLAKSQQDALKLTSQLDRTLQVGIEQEYKRSKLLESSSPFPVALADLLEGSDFKEFAASLSPEVFTRSAAGSTFLGSSDHALRKLGSTGELAITLADKVSTLVRSKINDTTTTLLPSMQEVAKDPASVIQLNKFLQAFHSLEGDDIAKLQYIDGGFFFDTKKTKPLKYLTGEQVSFEAGGSIDTFMRTWQTVQQDFTHAKNAERAMLGMDPLNPSRWWFPYDAEESQFRSYLISKTGTPDIKVLTASSKEHMESLLANIQAQPDLPYNIIPYGDTPQWNAIHGYAKLDPYIKKANIALQKSGTTFADVPPDARLLDGILETLSQQYTQIAKGIVENGPMSEVFNQLNQYTDFYKAAEASAPQPGKLKFNAAKPLSTPAVMRNTLLGISNVNEKGLYKQFNNVYSTAIDVAYNTVKSLLHKDPDLTDWNKMESTLAESGIISPWNDIAEFARASIPQSKEVAQHLVARSNAAQVMFNLSFLDLAHPLVNLLSLPVVSMAEMALSNPLIVSAKALMNGVKMAFSESPADLAIMKRAEEIGAVSPIVSEVSTMMTKLSVKPDIIARMEESDVGKFMSGATRWSEETTRKIAYATAYGLAKERAPDTTEALLEATANLFTKRVSGNYTHAQRPTMFQGAFGTTIGLYQTFAWTMAQNILRYTELGSKKALTTFMVGQAGTFGLSGLPGFEQVNNAIGNYVEGDIQQAAYSLFGNSNEQNRSMAEFVLFGYPSALLQSAIYTRGAMDARTPIGVNQNGFYFMPAVVSNTVETGRMFVNMAEKVGANIDAGGGMVDALRGVTEAISLQSVWRPAARMAELVQGHSLNRAGEIISGPDLVYEPWSMFARVLSTRPLQENIIKDLNYRNQYYNAQDQLSRTKVVNALRSSVMSGGLLPGSIDPERVQAEYLNRGGSMQGWKAAQNKAYLSLDKTYAEQLERQATKNPGIVDILDSY